MGIFVLISQKQGEFWEKDNEYLIITTYDSILELTSLEKMFQLVFVVMHKN